MTNQSNSSSATSDSTPKPIAEPSGAASVQAKSVARDTTAAATKPPRKPVFKVATKAVATKAKPAKQAAAAPKPVAKPPKKTETKPAAKKAAKPVPKVAKVAATKVSKPAIAKPAKEKKIKLVRDSIAIPKPEYVVLEELKLRAGKLAHSVKKTELIRAGIKALAAMADTAFLASVRAVPSLKTGRPSKQ